MKSKNYSKLGGRKNAAYRTPSTFRLRHIFKSYKIKNRPRLLSFPSLPEQKT